MTAQTLVVQIAEAAGFAAIEDSGALCAKGVVGADAKPRGVESVGLEGRVELELVVCNDLTLAALLIDQDTVLECYDGVGIACCLTL